MKAIYLIVFSLLTFAGYSQDKKAADLSQPPAIFVLVVDGKEYPVTEGQDQKLDGSFNNPIVAIKMANYRRFDNGTIAFNYKSNATYQYEESTGDKTWTLSANDCIVFLFQLVANVKLDALVTNIVTRFGKKNCKVESVSKRIGGKMVSGKQINVTLAGQKLVQEYYEIELNDSKTNILAFQNLKKDDGTIAEEGQAMVEMVTSSIKFGSGH
jgi:hypothetical protein